MSKKSSLHWDSLPENLKDRVMGEITVQGKKWEALALPLKTAKRSKYGNKKVEYDGKKFDSVKEKDFYLKLLTLQKAGEVTEIILQPRFDYEITYTLPFPLTSNSFKKTAFYKADFKVIYSDGHTEIIDIKGDWKGGRTKIYKQKKRIIETLYNIQIIEP